MNQPTIITREEAIEQGLKRYFTGKPCNNGHVEERYTSFGRCCQCSLDSARMYREKNLEKVNERIRKWRKENPDKVRESLQKYRNENPEKFRQMQLNRYKANPEKFKDKNRRYYEANREKINEQRRKLYKANVENGIKRSRDVEKDRERSREYVKKNKDKESERKKQWYKTKAGARYSLKQKLGLEPPDQLVDAVHIQRSIKRIIREQKQNQ